MTESETLSLIWDFGLSDVTDGADGLAIRKEKDDMRIAIRKTEKGFTLVELMIVVAIIGILAVLAIYGVSKYITNAKTAEARNAIGQIAKSAVGSFEEERADPALIAPGSSSATNQHQVCASASPVPDTLTKVQNKKYQASQAAGVDYGTGDKNTGWKCLKFALTEPQYFQYGYGADSSNNWTAAAHGDLKGAGAVAQGFAIGGKVVSGQMTVTPQIKESEGAPGDPGSGVTVSMP